MAAMASRFKDQSMIRAYRFRPVVRILALLVTQIRDTSHIPAELTF